MDLSIALPALALNDHVRAYVAHPGHWPLLEDVIKDCIDEYVGLDKARAFDLGEKVTPENYLLHAQDGIKRAKRVLGFSGDSLPLEIRLSRITHLTWNKLSKVSAACALLGAASSHVVPKENINMAMILCLGAALCTAGAQALGGPASFWYDHKNKQRGVIHSVPTSAVNYIPSIAHEFTHHVQRVDARLLDTKAMYLVEGHARVVETIVARQLFEESQDPAYLRTYLEAGLENLYRASQSTGFAKSSEARKVLIGDLKRHLPARLSARVMPHDIGYSALRIAERKHGPEIYHRLMRRDCDFLGI